MQFSFRKPHFWHSQNFAKTLFWHTVALFVFQKMPKKHYKTGEKTAKKNLDQFLTLDLDQFLTLETPNLGPVFNSTAYIYIPIYIFICLPGRDPALSRSSTLFPPLAAQPHCIAAIPTALDCCHALHVLFTIALVIGFVAVE